MIEVLREKYLDVNDASACLGVSVLFLQRRGAHTEFGPKHVTFKVGNEEVLLTFYNGIGGKTFFKPQEILDAVNKTVRAGNPIAMDEMLSMLPRKPHRGNGQRIPANPTSQTSSAGAPAPG